MSSLPVAGASERARERVHECLDGSSGRWHVCIVPLQDMDYVLHNEIPARPVSVSHFRELMRARISVPGAEY